jgi:hypothetical protein
MILLYRDNKVDSICLNTLLAKDGTGGCEVSLWLMKDLGTGVVNKHGTASISILVTGSTIIVNMATVYGGDIVIHGDTLTRNKVISFEDRFWRMNNGLGGLCWSTSASFGKETGCAFALKSFSFGGTLV